MGVFLELIFPFVKSVIKRITTVRQGLTFFFIAQIQQIFLPEDIKNVFFFYLENDTMNYFILLLLLFFYKTPKCNLIVS